MKTLILCFLLVVLGLFAAGDQPLAEPFPEKHERVGVPIGVLGLHLGTFAIIEGQRATGQGVRGTRYLHVTGINGKNLETPVIIWIENAGSLPANTNILLRGYESGRFVGQPRDVASRENWTPAPAPFQFQHYFVVSSILEPEALKASFKAPHSTNSYDKYRHSSIEP